MDSEHFGILIVLIAGYGIANMILTCVWGCSLRRYLKRH